MADDYSRQGETFRAKEVSGKKLPLMLVGEHVRIYDDVDSLAATGSAQSLTVPQGSTHATCYCEGATADDYVRYWEDGTAPTASVGKKLKDHEEIELSSPSTFKFIIGDGTLTLHVAFYHYA